MSTHLKLGSCIAPLSASVSIGRAGLVRHGGERGKAAGQVNAGGPL